MTTQVSTPSAARVGLGYIEETDRGQFQYETRTGTFICVDAGTTITNASSEGYFDGLAVGQPVTFVGGTLAGTTRNITAIDLVSDPNVLTVDGANFSTDTTTSIKVYPTIQELSYKSGGFEDSASYDDEAGAVVSESLRYGHRVINGFDLSGSVEDSLRLDQKFFDFVPSVMTNNAGWAAQEVQSGITADIAVVAGAPDTYSITNAVDGWLDNVRVGHFIKFDGAVTNSAANGEPFIVMDKDTTVSGSHAIKVLGSRALVAEAGATLDFTRARTIRDSNTFKTFQFVEFDSGIPFYRRFNGVAVGGLEVSADNESTATGNFSLINTADMDYSPKEGKAGVPFHSTVTSATLPDPLVGANMVFMLSQADENINEAYAVTSSSWNMQERYASIRTTKTGADAHDVNNLGGYYPTNFHFNHVNLSGSATFLFLGKTTKFYDRMKKNCKSRIDMKLQEKSCSGGGKVVIFSAPEVTMSFAPSQGENDGARTAEAEWMAAKWTNIDSDGTVDECCAQISVFE